MKIRTYPSYFFRGKDPIISKIEAVMQASGMSDSEISAKSGVSVRTFKNWRPTGKTKRPQFATMNATARACGQELEFRAINFSKVVKAKKKHTKPGTTRARALRKLMNLNKSRKVKDNV